MLSRALRQATLLLALALVPALVSGAFHAWSRKPDALEAGEVLAATAKSWGDRVLWVDARSRRKFEAGHMPGAVLLNEDEWDALVPAFLDEWDPEKMIVVYCDGGACDASRNVAARIRSDFHPPEKAGNVLVLKGGWAEWHQE